MLYEVSLAVLVCACVLACARARVRTHLGLFGKPPQRLSDVDLPKLDGKTLSFNMCACVLACARTGTPACSVAEQVCSGGDKPFGACMSDQTCW